LPELAIVVIAAMKHENDLAVGSIIGSNIFNIFLVLGGTAVVRQIAFDPKLILDLGFAILVTIFFYLFLLRKRKLTRLHGTILIGLYIIYMVSLSFREIVSAYLHIAN
jgi:cation:H+ antiporter